MKKSDVSFKKLIIDSIKAKYLGKIFSCRVYKKEEGVKIILDDDLEYYLEKSRFRRGFFVRNNPYSTAHNPSYEGKIDFQCTKILIDFGLRLEINLVLENKKYGVHEINLKCEHDLNYHILKHTLS